MKGKYVVDLDKQEREQLREVIRSKGHSGARRLRRAHTLLLLADGGRRTDEEIARALHAGVRTIEERTRKRFVEEGSEAALSVGAAQARRSIAAA